MDITSFLYIEKQTFTLRKNTDQYGKNCSCGAAAETSKSVILRLQLQLQTAIVVTVI